jgi:hypothetical protein
MLLLLRKQIDIIMVGVTVGRHWQANIPGRYLPVKIDGRLKAARLQDGTRLKNGGFNLDTVTIRISRMCFINQEWSLLVIIC